MRYFTPQRWTLLQDVSDEGKFDTAHREWQEALSGYREQLARLRLDLPARLLRFSEQECLHDAVLVAAWQGRSRVQLLVQPEPPENSLVLLTYTVVSSPQIHVDVLAPEYRTERRVWMYDEISLAQTKKSGRSEDGPLYEHSILLGNGWEITIRFTRFNYSRYRSLLPVGNGGGLLPARPALSQPA